MTNITIVFISEHRRRERCPRHWPWRPHDVATRTNSGIIRENQSNNPCWRNLCPRRSWRKKRASLLTPFWNTWVTYQRNGRASATSTQIWSSTGHWRTRSYEMRSIVRLWSSSPITVIDWAKNEDGSWCGSPPDCSLAVRASWRYENTLETLTNGLYLNYSADFDRRFTIENREI